MQGKKYQKIRPKVGGEVHKGYEATSISERTGAKKYWTIKEVGLIKAAVTEVFVQNLAVKIHPKGKARTAKSKFLQDDKAIASRMHIPENGFCQNISTSMEESRHIPGDILWSVVFKIVVGDLDNHDGNYVYVCDEDIKEEFVYPIDGEMSLKSPNPFFIEPFEKHLTKKSLNQVFSDLEGALENIDESQVIPTFKQILDVISVDDFKVVKEVIGEWGSDKGILPDLHKAQDNGVYTDKEMAMMRRRLGECGQKIREYVSVIRDAIEKYEKGKRQDSVGKWEMLVISNSSSKGVDILPK